MYHACSVRVIVRWIYLTTTRPVQRPVSRKDYYQAFLWVFIDLIVELLGLIIKPFDNQTESWNLPTVGYLRFLYVP